MNVQLALLAIGAFAIACFVNLAISAKSGRRALPTALAFYALLMWVALLVRYAVTL